MSKRDDETIAAWLAERTEPAPELRLDTMELYSDYACWAKAIRAYVVSLKYFATALQNLPNLEKRWHSRTRRSGFSGVRLKA